MIIALDLDDTLLNENDELDEENKNILKTAKEKGHKIIVSTLRSLPRCKDIACEINADYISCFLGNLCIDLEGNILRENTLPITNFDEVIESFSQVYNGWIGFESYEISVIANEQVASKYDGVTFIERTSAIEVLKKSKVFKLSFECKDDAEIISNFKNIAEGLGVGYKFSRGFRYIDLFPKNTDKVETLKMLKKKFDNEKVIAFGDDLSDKKSIEFADIGVCMLNGLDEVKAVADIVADTNQNIGVAKTLRELI